MTKEEKYELALNFKFESDIGNETLRVYFYELLSTLWYKEEGFSGKRPFGNSGWQYAVYNALVASGAIKGTLDEDGNVEDIDYKKSDKFIDDCIKYLMGIQQ